MAPRPGAASAWEPPARSDGRRARVGLLVLGVAVVAAMVVGRVAGDASGPGVPVTERTDPPAPAERAREAPARPASSAGGVWLRRGDAPLPVPAAHRAVWTGDALVAWGSEAQVAVYRLVERRWVTLGEAPVGALLSPVMVWTGSETLVWGGQRPDGSWSLQGAALDHRSGGWRALPDAPVAVRDPVAAWTGDQLLVWGAAAAARPGAPRSVLLRFDVERGYWVRAAAGPVSSVESASGAWTGRELLLWGRDGQGETFTAAYEPGRGWREHTPAPLDDPARAAAAWAGDAGRGELVLWGRPLAGHRSTAPPAGAALDPDTGRWRLLPAAPGYDWTGSRRGVQGLAAAWTGDQVIIVGGYPRSVTLAYDPATDSWKTLPELAGVIGPVVEWTGGFTSSTGVRRRGELLVWGGYGPYGPSVGLSTWRTVGIGPTSDGRLNTGS